MSGKVQKPDACHVYMEERIVRTKTRTKLKTKKAQDKKAGNRNAKINEHIDKQRIGMFPKE